MSTTISAQSWFGLVVYFVVMGFVIRGINITIPRVISTRIRRLLILLRLQDPVKTSPSLINNSIQLETLETTASESETNLSSTIPDAVEVVEFKNYTLPIDLRTAPVIGVLLLLATQTINVNVLRLGIVGENSVRPYDVLVLFISLAYISTALDATGALRSLSFYISQKAASVPKSSSSTKDSADKIANGSKLYSILYAFWFIMGVLVGNDPIVLSGTAFLAYFTRVTGITVPTAWIYSQFYAANIASAVLVSSNPTNVLIAGAFDLNFLTGYTKYTILPSFITAIVAYILTFLTFTFLKPPSRNNKSEPFRTTQVYIPIQLIPPSDKPRSVLLDFSGAIFHSSLMIITLILLVGTSFVKGGLVQVWMITGPAGIIAFLRDVISEYITMRSIKVSNQGSTRYSLPSFKNYLKQKFPITSSTISHLPLSLLPFAGGIFILTRSLTSLGWTSIFASWLSKICTTPTITVFFLGYLIAFVLCTICGTNIGATILMVEILTDENFINSNLVLLEPKILKGAIFSTAIASNLGAMSWTFSSSLAGLLWVSILKQKGIKVRARDFAMWNILFLPILSTVASSIIVLQLYYFS